MDERRFRFHIAVILGLLLFAGLRVAADSNPVYEFAEPVLAPLQSFSSDVRLGGDPADTPNEAVRAENSTLRAENDQLRTALGLATDEPLVRAEVTRRDVLGFRKFVWVNVGTDDGVQHGQTVLHNGALFGTVRDVYGSSAVVQTILDPDFRATVRVQGEQGILKVAYGSLLVDLIPSKDLAGGSIETNGLDSQHTAGVPVGRVGSLVSDAASVFGAYNVLLPYSLYDVDLIEIMAGETL